MNRFYTATEAAKVLGKSARWVHDEIAAKRLIAAKIGGDWRIEVDDLETYIAARKTVTTKPARARRPQARAS